MGTACTSLFAEGISKCLSMHIFITIIIIIRKYGSTFYIGIAMVV